MLVRLMWALVQVAKGSVTCLWMQLVTPTCSFLCHRPPSQAWSVPVSSVAEKTFKRRALRRELNRRSMLTYALRQDFVRSLEALL